MSDSTKLETCTNCGGIGGVPNHPHIPSKRCHVCGGSGKVRRRPPNTDLPPDKHENRIAEQLHADVMNFPCDRVKAMDSAAYAYGHCDARHGIAEMLLSHLALSSAEAQVRTLTAERDGWKVEARRCLELAKDLDDRANISDAWRGLLKRIEVAFGCSHVEHGPEDCDALVRQVREVIEQRDALRKQLERYVESSTISDHLSSARAEADAARLSVRVAETLIAMNDAYWKLVEGYDYSPPYPTDLADAYVAAQASHEAAIASFRVAKATGTTDAGQGE